MTTPPKTCPSASRKDDGIAGTIVSPKEINNLRTKGKRNPTQPTRVVIPNRQKIPDSQLAGLTRKWAEGWNEALDEVVRLNPSQ